MTGNDQPEPAIFNSDNDSVPTVVGAQGNYRVIRLLGRGTMSSVYLAEQISMARPVALKILSSSLAQDPAFVERFMREARAVARLNHPNIVSAFDFGEFESRFFLAMEFVDGEPLSALLAREGALEESRVIGIGLQVLAGLEHAKQHQVIHLDIKPANIMISKDGRVKLTDFGLAMILDTPGGVESGRRAVGTPYYMAPEQVEGGKLDWRADQYSLGASLYEAVTGNKPFQGTSVSDVLVKRFFEKPEPAWRTGRKKSTRAFSAILAKMMSRSPDGRYQSFKDMEEDFNRVKSGQKPVTARVASSTTHSAPTSTAWDSLGYTNVIRRVDKMLWSQRWNWFIYSSLLFMALLAGYGALHARQIMGPTPPSRVNSNIIQQGENLGEDRSKMLRDAWDGAMILARRAEVEHTSATLRRALYSLRLISTNREYKDSAYAAEAQRMVDIFQARLDELNAEQVESSARNN